MKKLIHWHYAVTCIWSELTSSNFNWGICIQHFGLLEGWKIKILRTRIIKIEKFSILVPKSYKMLIISCSWQNNDENWFWFQIFSFLFYVSTSVIFYSIIKSQWIKVKEVQKPSFSQLKCNLKLIKWILTTLKHIY